jgi:hypothetical protein
MAVRDAGELGEHQQAPVPLTEQAAGPAAAGQHSQSRIHPLPGLRCDRWQAGGWPAEGVPDPGVGAGRRVAGGDVVVVDSDDPPTPGGGRGRTVGEEFEHGGRVDRQRLVVGRVAPVDEQGPIRGVGGPGPRRPRRGLGAGHLYKPIRVTALPISGTCSRAYVSRTAWLRWPVCRMIWWASAPARNASVTNPARRECPPSWLIWVVV